jgi:hypothetical protein
VNAPLSVEQRAGVRELIKNALSKAGAYCGQCSFEPGDRAKCRDCERCWDWYAEAIEPLLDTSAERVPALLAELGQKTAEIERMRIERDRELTRLIEERDRCEEWADRLADAVGPIELIGEHSSDNNPWANALELITPHAEVERLRAELASQVRYAATLETAICQCEPLCEDGEYLHGADCPVAAIQMDSVHATEAGGSR